MRRLATILTAMFIAVVASAQNTGGIKGTVVNRVGRTPIQGATLVLQSGNEVILSENLGQDGRFSVEGLADGNYVMKLTSDGFTDCIIICVHF